MSYRDLEIWKLAREIAVAVHHMTLQELPKFEMYEEGLFDTGSLTNESAYRALRERLDLLGRKLNVFIEGVEREHRTETSHPASRITHPAS
jgi:hypothetical protein